MAIFHPFKLFYDFVIANASKYLLLSVAYHQVVHPIISHFATQICLYERHRSTTAASKITQ